MVAFRNIEEYDVRQKAVPPIPFSFITPLRAHAILAVDKFSGASNCVGETLRIVTIILLFV